jgi:UDP-N-acetylmuramate dehydrogenase
LISISEIQKFFKGRISLNEPLAGFTTFRIGGEADYYVEPSDSDDALNIVRYLNKQGVPFYVMGNGSNVLISDEGIRGVVINLESSFNFLRHEEGVITAGSGVKVAKFVDFCIQNGYAGVEMLAGIPATVGGALVMNAGAYGGETSTYVTEVTTIIDNDIKHLSKQESGFMYRNSSLKGSVILEAKFALPVGDKTEIIKRRKSLLLHRNEAQPVEVPNAGCIFKNPGNNKAAILIQECGLKGAAFGGAMVSFKHANFIVNTGNASANDVIELVRIIRRTVKEKTGIDLEMEVKLVGFEEVMI